MAMLEVVREKAKDSLERISDLMVGDVFFDAEDEQMMMVVDVECGSVETSNPNEMYAVCLEDGLVHSYNSGDDATKRCKLVKSARLYCKE